MQGGIDLNVQVPLALVSLLEENLQGLHAACDLSMRL